MVVHTTTSTIIVILQPLFRTASISWHSQLKLGDFLKHSCLPGFPCWRQLAYLN